MIRPLDVEFFEFFSKLGAYVQTQLPSANTGLELSKLSAHKN